METENKVPAEKPARTAPDKPDPRPSNGKPRKPEVRVLPMQQREDAKKGESKTEFKLDIKRVPAQQKAEAPKPEPVAPPSVTPTPVPPPTVAVKKESAEPAKPAAKETKLAAPPSSKPVVEAGSGTWQKETRPKADIPEAAKEVAPLPAAEQDLLGLPETSTLRPKEASGPSFPAAARIGVAAGLLAAIAGGIFLTSKGSSATRAAIAHTAEPAVFPAGPPIGSDAGWATDWFTDSPGGRQARHVDVLRGSLALRDYRLEMEGQIDQGAIGWVFRANNKSFYAEKVAIVTPGLEPTVALVRITVVDGKEVARGKASAAAKGSPGYALQDPSGCRGPSLHHFVQDQQVDEWNDSRIEAGGAGLYYDGGESAHLTGTSPPM